MIFSFCFCFDLVSIEFGTDFALVSVQGCGSNDASLPAHNLTIKIYILCYLLSN